MVVRDGPFQTLDFCLVHARIVGDIRPRVTTGTGENLRKVERTIGS